MTMMSKPFGVRGSDLRGVAQWYKFTTYLIIMGRLFVGQSSDGDLSFLGSNGSTGEEHVFLLGW